MHLLPARRKRAVAAAAAATGALVASLLAVPALTLSAAAAPSACLTPWSSATTYTGGQTVSYGGTNYRAKWWTLGETPGASQWGAWESTGTCGTEPTDPPTTTEPTDPPTTTEPTDPPTTAEPTDPPTTTEPTDPPTTAPPVEGDEACRPDGMYRTPGVKTPYCDVYDTDGVEKLPNGLDRRIIGYFTSWRTGQNGTPTYLANNIPWDKISHINYAFAHIDKNNEVSAYQDRPGNEATDRTWPGVPGAEMDPSLPYTGHFNLLQKYKKANPGVKIIPAVGGWTESGGYHDENGKRVASGGFYEMTKSQANIDKFADSAVRFIREYGFDGLDIDYEYPTSNNQAGNPDDFWIADKNRGTLFKGYEALLKTLREKLDKAAAEDGQYYMLTVAAPSSGWLLRGMEMYQVTQYLDYVNLMSYDLHGAWNEYVGGNNPLFDNGKDPELLAGNIYGAYNGIGYLNGDWAAKYFRSGTQGGRINLGVGFYTRGWDNVQGGNYGDGGRAPAPAGYTCAPGTSGKCGQGAVGVANLWHDSDPMGGEVPAGANPIWHALNLAEGRVGDYAEAYGVTDTLKGEFSHHFDDVSKNEWWWNPTTKTYISGDTVQAVQAKADYVKNTGLGGIMIWEFAGDYGFNKAKGQYEMGQTMVDAMHKTFSTAGTYSSTKAEADRPMPTKAIDLSIKYTEFALGDNNYPISPKVVFTNNSKTDIPAGATISFQYSTSNPGGMSDWSGMRTTVTKEGHTGNNVGGLKGNYHTAEFAVPLGGIPAGGSITNQLKWSMPTSAFSNVIVTIGSEKYATTYDFPRGATVVEPTGGAGHGGDNGGGDGNGGGNGNGGTGSCAGVAEYSAATVYTGGQKATYKGNVFSARYWTQGAAPDASSPWGAWQLVGAC
ncbi:glycosyl hydrolase family 18 protein [Flavimobilis rhizosphaerae]|uniref:glycosyl hydrolase family 18 protein n=1 Tax=Flavimobilis rhizosphaerae TaxID=2775421 RepID=UPI001B357540|nr:glycosyl hydrolase family 18 protein [Flavimobilis rhizosphaerae]